MRRNSIAVLVAIAACALAVFLPATASAQGNSAVDQYVEQVPGGDGNRPADKPGGDQGGRPQDGAAGASGSSGSGSGGSGSGGSEGSGGLGSGGSDGKSDGKSGGKSGKKKDKTSDDTDESAIGGDDPGGTGGGDAAGELAKANVPAAAGTEDGGGFPIVALLIIAGIGGLAFLAWWKFAARRGSSPAADGPADA